MQLIKFIFKHWHIDAFFFITTFTSYFDSISVVILCVFNDYCIYFINTRSVCIEILILSSLDEMETGLLYTIPTDFWSGWKRICLAFFSLNHTDFLIYCLELMILILLPRNSEVHLTISSINLFKYSTDVSSSIFIENRITYFVLKSASSCAQWF